MTPLLSLDGAGGGLLKPQPIQSIAALGSPNVSVGSGEQPGHTRGAALS